MRIVAVSVGSTVLAYAMCGQAQAQTVDSVAPVTQADGQADGSAKVFSFDVGPDKAADVLAAIAAQASITLETDQGRRKLTFRSPGVRGRHTVRSAIAAALQGTGHHAEFDGAKVRIVDDSSRSDDIIVTAAAADFLHDQSAFATRTLTPVHDTPGTVDSVTQATLKSQNAISFVDAMRNIPGVAIINNNLTGTTAVFGPDQNSTTFLDGMRVNGLAQNEPTVGLESIEVLKGPASLLTGSAVAGGTINFVPKRATGTSPDEISLGVGSGGEVTATADIGGRTPIKGLFYRVVGLSQFADHLIKGGNNPHSRLVMGMLGYRSDHTRVDVVGSYSDDRIVDQDFYYYNTRTATFDPWGAAINKDSYRSVRTARIVGNVEQDLISTDDLVLKFRGRAKYEKVDLTSQTQYPEYISGNNQYTVLINRGFFTNGTALVDSYAQLYGSSSVSFYGDLYGRFSTGPLHHQLIVAGDTYHDYTDQNRFSTQPQTPTGQTPSLLGLDGSNNYVIKSTVIPRHFVFGSTQQGVVAQDLVEVGPLHVLVAGRWSWYSDFNRELIRGLISSSTQQHKFLPNAGVVLDISKPVAVYFNFSNSFTPRSSSFQQADGSIVPPTIRNQIEAGFKYAVPGKRLSITASAFRYETNNTPIFSGGFYTTGPGQRAKGVEISATGRVYRGLDVTAGYVYTEGSYKDGRVLYSAPQHVANLWAVQSIALGARQKLTIGLGGNYQSNVYVFDLPAAFTPGATSTFKLDHPFFSVNTAIGYKMGKTSLNLTADNIFNRLNLQTPYLTGALQVSTPQRIRLTLSQQF